MKAESKSARPAVVLGVSGATWRVIEPLMAKGKLPNISRLCGGGASGTMRSIRAENDKHFRPQTAWPTMASGLRPERHGVETFFDTASDAKAPMIWDIFQQDGSSVGLYGWPVTWPPSSLNGFVIPSHLGRDGQTWPPALAPIKQLDRQQQRAEREGDDSGAGLSHRMKLVRFLLQNGLGPAGMSRLGYALARLLASRDAETRSLILRHAKLDLSADLFFGLSKQFKPGFSAFTTFLVDLVSHRYWRYYEPDRFSGDNSADIARYRNAVADAYIHVDKVLGRILSRADDDTVVAFVSEHGMEAEPDSAEVGDWRYVIRGESLTSSVGLGPEVEVCPVARWVALRVNENSETQDDVAERMRNLTVAETGLPLFQVHLHRDDEVIIKFNLHRDREFYASANLEQLTIRYKDQSFPFTSIAKRLGKTRSAMHDGDAVLMIGGPGIKRGCKLEGATLVDFMPTMLHACRLPVPEGLDGKVLDIFD